MEMQQIVGFLAVARTGSFSMAARETYRSQPAISHQIRVLEAELGARLFDRFGKKAVLTAPGRQLASRAARIVAELKGIKNDLCRDDAKGSLVIATHSSVMLYIIPKAVKLFLRKFPDADLKLLNRGASEIVELVAAGEVDLGIAALSSVPRELNYEVLGRYRRMLVCEKNHPLSKLKHLSLESLSKYALILPPEGGHTRSAVESAFAAKKLTPRVKLEITGRDAIKHYVGLNLGVSIMNEYYLDPKDRRGLCAIDASALFGHSERGLVIRKGRSLSFLTREFIAPLKREMLRH